MDKHNPHHLMLKLSKFLPSSFTSCQFKNLNDVADSSIDNPKNTPPAASAAASSAAASSWFTSSDDLDADTSFFSLSSTSGDSFHLRAASSRFHLMKSIDESTTTAAAAGKKPVITKSPDRRHEMELGSDHFSTQLYYRSCRRRRASRSRRKIKNRGGGGGGVVIGESYAVEKSSRDPRGDFRASMVEMIVEKQIFAAPDLDRLLRCFLSLNSAAYHQMIVEVFNEICETLFTN